MQLCEFTYMTRSTTKQNIARQYIGEIIRIEVTESGARGDTEMIPVVPIPLQEGTSTFGGVWSLRKPDQRHEGFTQVSCEHCHEGLAHFH